MSNVFCKDCDEFIPGDFDEAVQGNADHERKGHETVIRVRVKSGRRDDQ